MNPTLHQEHKHKNTTTPKTRVLRVYVGQDDEVGVVFAFANPNGPGIKVRGQKKRFGNEQKKLDFLAEIQESGFRRFVDAENVIDTEQMVFEVLTDLQQEKQKTGSEKVMLR